MKSAVILSNRQKIFSIQELEEMGFSQYKIRNLVSEGQLKKLNKTYYENTEYCGEESDFYYIKAYAPKGVVCLLSAAVYYNLSTYIPDAVDIAIPRKGKMSTMPEYPRINVHYYTDERYELGVTPVREEGNEFRIYDMEKTVVDIVPLTAELTVAVKCHRGVTSVLPELKVVGAVHTCFVFGINRCC